MYAHFGAPEMHKNEEGSEPGGALSLEQLVVESCIWIKKAFPKEANFNIRPVGPAVSKNWTFPDFDGTKDIQ